jgi:ketosteroid isomerase-like protein
MDHATVQSWLDRYVEAWRTYDPDLIADLFSEDVAYRYHAYDEPIWGRDAVVRSWLGETSGGGASTRDKPGTYDAAYAPVAVDGDVAVATGTSSYRRGADGPFTKVFHNIFVLRFDADGRCRELTEWYVKQPA